MYARYHHPGSVWWARRSTIPRRSPYEEGALPVELQARNAGYRAEKWKAREDPPLHYEIQNLGCYWLHYGPLVEPREGVEPSLFGVDKIAGSDFGRENRGP